MVTVFLMHPNAKIALAATECLALIGKVEPIWGVSLLPVVLFCLRFRGNIQELNESNVQVSLRANRSHSILNSPLICSMNFCTENFCASTLEYSCGFLLLNFFEEHRRVSYFVSNQYISITLLSTLGFLS